MTDDLKDYIVVLEKGKTSHVLAINPDEAVDQYYENIKSTSGHIWGMCGCFGPPKPLDRSKFLRPLKVLDFKTQEVLRIFLYPNLKDQGW